MRLKYKVSTLDGIDAVFHPLYTKQDDDTFLLTGVEGIKTQEDIDRLQTSLNNERNAHKETKKKVAPLLAFGEVADVVAKLDRFDELETAAEGKLDEAKMEKLVEGRLRTKIGPIERERDELKTKLSEREKEVETYKTTDRKRTIGDAVRNAALKTGGFQKTALDDALLLGENIFELNEAGKVVTRDNVGVTPGLDPAVWLSDMKDKRPHWFEGSGGGGAGGSGGGGGKTNPFRKADWNVTEQGNLVRQNPELAQQMATAAGVKIGATAPVK